MGMGKIKVMNQSQHNIEDIVGKFFTEPGFFVEIGCWDGEHISQTAVLERQGWQGICVDPFPRNFDGRTCRVIEKAVAGKSGQRDFIKVSIDRRYGGDVSYFSGFADQFGKDPAIKEIVLEHCDYEEVKVDCVTPDELFEQCNVPKFIHFLSVDTEGSELEIFQAIDFEKYAFGVIVFEHNRNQEAKEKIGKILWHWGYVLHRSIDIDDVYVNADLVF